MKNIITLILVVIVLVIVFMITRTVKDATENVGKIVDSLTKETIRLENLQVSELSDLQQIGTVSYEDCVKFE